MNKPKKNFFGNYLARNEPDKILCRAGTFGYKSTEKNNRKIPNDMGIFQEVFTLTCFTRSSFEDEDIISDIFILQNFFSSLQKIPHSSRLSPPAQNAGGIFLSRDHCCKSSHQDTSRVYISSSDRVYARSWSTVPVARRGSPGHHRANRIHLSSYLHHMELRRTWNEPWNIRR